MRIRVEGYPVNTGQVWEITVQGPNVMIGYYDDKEQTTSFLPATISDNRNTFTSFHNNEIT